MVFPFLCCWGWGTGVSRVIILLKASDFFFFWGGGGGLGGGWGVQASGFRAQGFLGFVFGFFGRL